ncbi:hypothetical protein CLV30_13111 [Haloactinopolyspora alba]|uniref:Uncharacterized protein n=1 Tax=Haloactinopolyspora alba TaxID=648780 RepID=A0A2P8D6Y1_9ACTN|nr:hypothetical protein [Haloactinopolyspora alba]PSK92986.1 hypothetical protein CLV30_13111 [Haloactinopolyspora alba]
MEIAALVVSVVALLISLWAAWAVRLYGGQSQQERTPVAEELRRPPDEPHFRFEHTSRHRYVLYNDGPGTAYAVRLEVGEISVHEGSLGFDQFPPGHAEEYLLIQPLSGPLSEITLSWHAQRDGLDPARATPLPLDTPASTADADQQEA